MPLPLFPLFKVFHPHLFTTEQVSDLLVTTLFRHVTGCQSGRIPLPDQGESLATDTGTGKAEDHLPDSLDITAFCCMKKRCTAC